MLLALIEAIKSDDSGFHDCDIVFHVLCNSVISKRFRKARLRGQERWESRFRHGLSRSMDIDIFFAGVAIIN